MMRHSTPPPVPEGDRVWSVSPAAVRPRGQPPEPPEGGAPPPFTPREGCSAHPLDTRGNEVFQGISGHPRNHLSFSVLRLQCTVERVRNSHFFGTFISIAYESRATRARHLRVSDGFRVPSHYALCPSAGGSRATRTPTTTPHDSPCFATRRAGPMHVAKQCLSMHVTGARLRIMRARTERKFSDFSAPL
jgi:hypothetical protein